MGFYFDLMIFRNSKCLTSSYPREHTQTDTPIQHTKFNSHAASNHRSKNSNNLSILSQDVSNKVTVDELTLELEDMKVSSVILAANLTDVVTERKLLRPTSFKLFVKRSLSTWYEALPDLDVSGKMQTIAVSRVLLSPI